MYKHTPCAIEIHGATVPVVNFFCVAHLPPLTIPVSVLETGKEANNIRRQLQMYIQGAGDERHDTTIVTVRQV